jgi:hypothetical protein
VDYFRPTSRWHPRDPDGSPHRHNRALLGTWEDLYTALLHRFPVRPFGIYLLLVAAFVHRVWSAFATVRRSKHRARAQEKVVLFMALNCAYVPAVSCLLTIGELERFRFMVEALMWIVGTAALGARGSRDRVKKVWFRPPSP